jgi:hypothetical protein
MLRRLKRASGVWLVCRVCDLDLDGAPEVA